jgi:streptomycin 6-kinase
MPFLPGAFIQTITELFDERGIAWLGDLPNLIAECERRWSLKVLPPFDLSYNYVAPAIRTDGTEVVVKLGVPNPELLTEIAALRLWNGHGIVQLLDADTEQGILLLERLRPGTPLATLEDDEQATRIAARLMGQLRRPAPPDHPFPTVDKWAEGIKRLRRRFDGGAGPLPAQLVETAESLFAELLDSQSEPVLLHGDLHHWNILAAERQPWLALDPKGLVGEAAYEVGAWLRNPLPGLLNQPHPDRITVRRIDLLSEMLGFDRQRMIGWGLAQAVLSAWWSIEDHGQGWEEAIAIAEILSELRNRRDKATWSK